jgi:hypothetical protein
MSEPAAPWGTAAQAPPTLARKPGCCPTKLNSIVHVANPSRGQIQVQNSNSTAEGLMGMEPPDKTLS